MLGAGPRHGIDAFGSSTMPSVGTGMRGLCAAYNCGS
jgi:hypothetical protein